MAPTVKRQNKRSCFFFPKRLITVHSAVILSLTIAIGHSHPAYHDGVKKRMGLWGQSTVYVQLFNLHLYIYIYKYLLTLKTGPHASQKICTQAHTAERGGHGKPMKVARGSRIQTISSMRFQSHILYNQRAVSRRLLLQLPREGLWRSGFLNWLHWMRNYISIHTVYNIMHMYTVR